MRALWVPDLEIRELYSISGDKLHHLAHVVRVELGEDLLLLNGKGLFVHSVIESLSKKELRAKYASSETRQRSFDLDLALGIPKKDALDLSLKMATELGLRNIYLIRSDYSQTKLPESERLENILVSALEQSNAPFLPTIHTVKWEDIPWTSYADAALLSSQSRSAGTSHHKRGPRLLLVGPEGGFSPEEIAYFAGLPNLRTVNLPTPILRTPTALAAGVGLLLESLRNQLNES